MNNWLLIRLNVFTRYMYSLFSRQRVSYSHKCIYICTLIYMYIYIHILMCMYVFFWMIILNRARWYLRLFRILDVNRQPLGPVDYHMKVRVRFPESFSSRVPYLRSGSESGFGPLLATGSNFCPSLSFKRE